MRNSGRYPLCGRGDINVYTIFAEGMRNILAPKGRVGCVLPSGIASDDTSKFFFQDLVKKKSLVSLFDFENKGIFEEVHSSFKFCLFTSGSSVQTTAVAAEFAFFAHTMEDLRDEERRYVLFADDIVLLNPFTSTCPIFRTRRDAELTKAVYKRAGVLGQEASKPGWDVEYLLKLVDPTIHRDLLLTQAGMSALLLDQSGATDPGEQAFGLYEGKQIFHFDHRYATFVGEEESRPTPLDSKFSPDFSIVPRYWLREADFKARLRERPIRYHAFLSVRDITNVTNERTVVTAVRPFLPALNSLGNLFCRSASDALFLCGCLNSYSADYVARQKVGGTHLSPFYLMQLAVVRPTNSARIVPWSQPNTAKEWVGVRVLELTYTTWDLQPFARDCGYLGPPFRWDEERRFLLRCELDAAFFHLYLPADTYGDWRPVENESAEDRARLKASFFTPRDAVAYIMDTFPIVKRKDKSKWNGEYRTKRAILEIYDAMAEAARTGIPYQTRLSPPPADAAVAHPWPVELPQQVHALPDPLAELSAVANATWGTPIGVSPDNVALFTLIEVMRILGGPVDSERVLVASNLVRSPAIAAAFMDESQAVEWARVIGQDAQPLTGNVIQDLAVSAGNPRPSMGGSTPPTQRLWRHCGRYRWQMVGRLQTPIASTARLDSGTRRNRRSTLVSD